MPDYRYYVETYLGEDIPEADFPRLIRRAQAELARMRDVYAVQSRPGLDPAEADAMAVCAVADAMYEFDQEDAARGLAKVTVGSVAHPMDENHYIEWIELLADNQSLPCFLKPGDKPEAVFKTDAEKVTAREYCNLHGHWKAEN